MMAREAGADRSTSLVDRLVSFVGSAVVGQSVVLAAASGMTSLIGGITKIVLASVLSTVGFGTLALATTVLQLTGMFFEFGLFLPAARMAALAREPEGRAITGAALVLFVPVGLACSVAVLGLSFFADSIFNVSISHALRAVVPLVAVYPFAYVALTLAQGVDRLHVYSITSLLAPIVFLLALAPAAILGWHLTVSIALLMRTAALGLGAAAFVIWLRPSFVRCRPYASALVRQAREYGFAVYTGRVLSLATYNMDVLMLGALADARAVGLYSLAGAVASAFGLPVTGLADALFARMTAAPRLHARWLLAAWSVGTLGALGAWVACLALTATVLSHSYDQVRVIVIPLALAQIVRGSTAIYNSFLAAHRQGRQLRAAGFTLSACNIVFNVALIPPFGAMGAAWASLLALFANLLVHVVSYRRLELLTTA